MKATKKFACLVLSVWVLLVAATAACAASFTFSNSLGIRMSITMVYIDADTTEMTTKGWWHVEPGGQTVITVNADESKDVYYAAYNKGQYYDSSTLGNRQERRWASPRTFTYTSDERPYDDGVWQGTFYRIDGLSVHIDTSEAVGGTRENTARAPASTTRPSVERNRYAGDADDAEALGDRLSTEYLSNAELAGASTDTLAYLRNRIYATYGYNFQTQRWKNEFSRYDWYRPNPNFSDKLFNTYERDNLKRIMAEEKRR